MPEPFSKVKKKPTLPKWPKEEPTQKELAPDTSVKKKT